MLLSCNAVPKLNTICPPHYLMHTSSNQELTLKSASQHVLHDHSLQSKSPMPKRPIILAWLSITRLSVMLWLHFQASCCLHRCHHQWSWSSAMKRLLLLSWGLMPRYQPVFLAPLASQFLNTPFFMTCHLQQQKMSYASLCT